MLRASPRPTSAAAHGRATLVAVCISALSLGVLLHQRITWASPRSGTCAASGVTPAWAADIAEEYTAKQHEIQALQAQWDLLSGGRKTTSRHVILYQAQPASTNISQPFLFIAVLSTANSSRRGAVRQTWMRTAPEEVLVRFILSEEEKTPAAEQEAQRYGDMVFVREGSGTGYRSIVFKIYLLVEWAVANVDAKFVLKTDDDAYVDCGRLVAELRSLCQHPDCVDEKLYMGEEKRNGEVIVEEGHKWSNEEYFRLTGLKEYAPYMFGGGYIFSMDVAKALVQVNRLAPLKFMPNEDSTFGFWVMGMDLRKIDHPKVRTAAGHCCYTAQLDDPTAGRWRRFAMRGIENVCAGWLILHKVDTDDQMRYIHERLLQCPTVLSLQAHAHLIAQRLKYPLPVMGPMENRRISDANHGFHFSAGGGLHTTSPDGRLQVVLQTQQLPHAVLPKEAVQIGLVNMSHGMVNMVMHEGQGGNMSHALTITGNEQTQRGAHTRWQWQALDTSHAWNYQMGAAAQWLGPSNRYIVFNDRGCGEGGLDDVCSVVFDVVERRRKHSYPHPIWAVAPDGKHAIVFDPHRLHVTEQGFGYPPGPHTTGPHMSDARMSDMDGLAVMDLTTGERRVVVQYTTLFEFVSKGPGSFKYDKLSGHQFYVTQPLTETVMKKCKHWINHMEWSPRGESIAFVYKIGRCKGSVLERGHVAFVFTVDSDGRNLWRVPVVRGGRISYGVDGVLAVCDDVGYYLVQNHQDVRKLAANVKPNYQGEDKNDAAATCTLRPHDNRYLLVDRYLGWSRQLFVWDVIANDTLTLGHMSGRLWDGPQHTHAGLRARWTSDGQAVLYDSAHNWGYGSQTYMVGLNILQGVTGSLSGGSLPQQHDTGAQYVYIIAALLSARDVQEVLLMHGGAGENFVIHAFQVGALDAGQHQQLHSYLDMYNLSTKVVLHPEALHASNGTLLVNTKGVCRDDAALDDIAAVLVAPDANQEDKIARWTPRFEAAWAPWRTHKPHPDGLLEDPGMDVEVQALDISAWLVHNVQPTDKVVMWMDVGGRVHELLSRLLLEESLLLIDTLHIKWHMQHLNWEWPLMWEGIFSLLHVNFTAEVAPLPRMVLPDGRVEGGTLSFASQVTQGGDAL